MTPTQAQGLPQKRGLSSRSSLASSVDSESSFINAFKSVRCPPPPPTPPVHSPSVLAAVCAGRVQCTPPLLLCLFLFLVERACVRGVGGVVFKLRPGKHPPHADDADGTRHGPCAEGSQLEGMCVCGWVGGCYRYGYGVLQVCCVLLHSTACTSGAACTERLDPWCSGLPLQEVSDVSETSHQGARCWRGMI